jgi:hypothetical protein
LSFSMAVKTDFVLLAWWGEEKTILRSSTVMGVKTIRQMIRSPKWALLGRNQVRFFTQDWQQSPKWWINWQQWINWQLVNGMKCSLGCALCKQWVHS